MVGVPQHEAFASPVHGLAEFGGLQTLTPLEVIGVAAAGEAYGRNIQRAEGFDHIPPHAVEVICGQKGNLIDRRFTADSYAEAPAADILTCKGKGQLGIRRTVFRHRHGLLQPLYSIGDLCHGADGLDPYTCFVRPPRLQGDERRRLGHEAVFEYDEMTLTQAFLRTVCDTLKALADPAVHGGVSHEQLAVV